MHDGAAPGVSAVVAAALEDGVGVIVLANAGDKQPYMIDIIGAVADKAFGLETGTSASANTSTLRRRAEVSAREQSSTAAPDILDLAGIYHNAGYGTAELCSVRSSSSSCQSVLADFRSVDNSLSSNSTDLFASWITTITSHVRFTYANDSQFILSTGFIYPEGYGKNSTPFSTLSPGGLATFVVENESVLGFGVSGISGVERTGPVKEASDVWFDKQA
jgi:hypothetical protein